MPWKDRPEHWAEKYKKEAVHLTPGVAGSSPVV